VSAAQLNLDVLWWNFVEFTAIRSIRHERRVSSIASRMMITDLLQASHAAAVLAGLLGGLLRLCASPGSEQPAGRGRGTGGAALALLVLAG